MRIALPVFEGRVSSVFDWAKHLVVFVIGSNGRSPTRIAEIEVGMDGLTPEGRGRRLAELGVDTLICGGISMPLAELVESQGVKVVAGVVGGPDAVLNAFMKHGLDDPTFAMPGWRRCGRHGRRRGGQGDKGHGQQLV